MCVTRRVCDVHNAVCAYLGGFICKQATCCLDQWTALSPRCGLGSSPRWFPWRLCSRWRIAAWSPPASGTCCTSAPCSWRASRRCSRPRSQTPPRRTLKRPAGFELKEFRNSLKEYISLWKMTRRMIHTLLSFLIKLSKLFPTRFKPREICSLCYFVKWLIAATLMQFFLHIKFTWAGYLFSLSPWQIYTTRHTRIIPVIASLVPRFTSL